MNSNPSFSFSTPGTASKSVRRTEMFVEAGCPVTKPHLGNAFQIAPRDRTINSHIIMISSRRENHSRHTMTQSQRVVS